MTEDELRRYLRAASVLLAVTAAAPCDRVRILRRARSWACATVEGIEQLLHEAELDLSARDTLDEPLTGPARLDRMETAP